MKKILSIVLLVFVLVLPFGGASAQAAPSVVDTTIPVDPAIRAAVDAWLAYDAPIPLPYWAITYTSENADGTFVSLVALDLLDPNANWHITDNNVVAWMGSVIVHIDETVEVLSDGGFAEDQLSAVNKQAVPNFAAGGGSHVRFPWDGGGTMMYGPNGVHAAGGGGAYAAGFSAVDFVGGDDMGSGVASNRMYAVATGTVDYVCADSTTTLVRTENTSTDEYYIYAHLLTNANLVEDHVFSKGSLVGNVKYGSFDDTCGYASQTDKHYHLHFGFKPLNNSFRMENCILSLTNSKWTCGTQVISTGQFLKGGGGISGTGDDGGISVDQPSFWDYALVGAVSLWDEIVVQNMPEHTTIQYTYVVYSTVKLMLKLARVMLYSNLNLGHFMAVLFIGLGIKAAFGVAEFIVFLFKAWKSLVPILGA